MLSPGCLPWALAWTPIQPRSRRALIGLLATDQDYVTRGVLIGDACRGGGQTCTRWPRFQEQSAAGGRQLRQLLLQFCKLGLGAGDRLGLFRLRLNVFLVVAEGHAHTDRVQLVQEALGTVRGFVDDDA